jgi:hypothetical protein
VENVFELKLEANEDRVGKPMQTELEVKDEDRETLDFFEIVKQVKENDKNEIDKEVVSCEVTGLLSGAIQNLLQVLFTNPRNYTKNTLQH